MNTPHIWVPNKHIKEAIIDTSPKKRIAGFYTIRAIKPDGRARLIVKDMPNLITNAGLLQIPISAILTYCSIGSGTNTPSETDVSLGAYITHTTMAPVNYTGVGGTSPDYYGYAIQRATFAPPGTNINFTEVGVGWGTSGNNLFSRALTVDIAGDPVTITWLAEETLIIDYELRTYIFTNDVPFSAVVSGTTHTGTFRAVAAAYAGLTTIRPDAPRAMTKWIGNYSASSPILYLDTNVSALLALTALGQNGTVIQYTAVSGATFNNAQYRFEGNITIQPEQANYTNGINWFSYQGGWQAYQALFSPAIMKTNVDTLVLGVTSTSFGRKA